MLVNYFKIAVRYLLKNRTFSVINLLGLTLGFLCFILIILFLQDELGYDQFHSDADRIYRVLQHEQKADGTLRDVAPVSARIAPESATQITGVEDAVRISSLGRITVGNDPATRNYEPIYIADSNFFHFFDYRLLVGDPAKALSTPDGVVLSQTLATKYFGKENAVGKRLWTSAREFTVTGVMEDMPHNSHMQIPLIFAEITWANYFDWYKNFMNTDWVSNSFITYIKLKPGVPAQNIDSQITSMVKGNYPKDREFKSTFSLQPLARIHMYSENIQGNDVNANGMKPFYVYMFAVVAFLILLIACLNYMNLSTAAAFKRTREIGTRKTLGAQRMQLLTQFSGEAIILSVLSLALAVSILQTILPFVNDFLQKKLSVTTFPLPWTIGVIAVMLLAGMLSSLYPAFIISRVRPAEAIKKDVRIGNRGIPVRKMLVVAQFTVSIMMIASTLIIYRQLSFMKSKDLGFENDSLLVVDINSDPLRRNFENVKAAFASVPEVQSISTSTRVPGEWKSFPITSVTTAGQAEPEEMIYVGIDQDFLSTYKIELLEGRNFISGQSDSMKVILTKLAVKELNLENPIGQIIEIPSVRWGGSVRTLQTPFRCEVIGIADDFHFESFRQKMMPVIFAAPNTVIQRIDYYTMKIQTSDWDRTIASLKEVNNKIAPDDPLEYTFLDGRFEAFYQADEKRGQVFLAFSCIIVFIACMGLFALVSYSIEARTKEIGIRKVLGATVSNIVTMISREFLTLVVLAGFIGIPVAWYLMRAWLQDFAYHVPLSAGTFALAGLIAIAIALITIGFRAIRAAVSNPVNALKSE